ncbi:HAD family hydrolase [Pseudorhodoferax sp.]|uniref:HAD family hydrolase n=1 Tax=Pseudorhodoferax sp. TaxID=1993553 RepID=UPI002DD641C5|nr:HAD family phosphatase [Pseudorhodoferax sp.]
MRYGAVLFDCDGVLVDSEPITNGVLRDMLAELGWAMSNEECMARFIGKAVKEELEIIEARTGVRLDAAWETEFRRRRNEALAERLQAIPHIHATVQAVHQALDSRIACASGADLGKVALQLKKVGLIGWFEGRIFSGYDTPRSKPFPDVYLAAAAALGVDPRHCAVVEDTVTGVTAGVAAGATVFGFCPDGPGRSTAASLQAAGATTTFTAMDELPALLRL